jgi:hypothetical protein
MNNLIKQQSQPDFICLLKAQRVAYSNAKNHYWVDVVSVSFAALSVVLPILQLDCKADLVILNVIWWIIWLFLADRRSANTKKGATIQEMFDVELFQLDWNFIKLPQKVLPDEIVRLSRLYTKSDLTNWYSPLISSELPHAIAVLLCYKNNIAWGVADKVKFRNFIVFLGIAYLIWIIGYAFLHEFSLGNTCLLVAPSLSFFKYCWDAYRNLNAYIKKHQELNNTVEKLLGRYKTTKVEPTKLELRQLQDEIFIQRTIPHEIPDWFYNFHKGKTEAEVDEILKNIIKKLVA